MILKLFFSVVGVLLSLYFFEDYTKSTLDSHQSWVNYKFVDYTKSTLDSHQSWVNYKKKFNKTYGADDDLRHLAIFEESLKIVKAHNERFEQSLETYRMGINQFSDMGDTKLKSYALGGCYFPEKLQVNLYGDTITSGLVPPDSIDWRDQQAVTPVKDQGEFASCWAFSVLGALESAMKIQKRKTPISLSAQQLVDCEPDNDSVKGGNILKAYEYAQKCGGLQSDSDYPYNGTKGVCKFNKNKVVVKISGHNYPTAFDEDRLKQACGIHGPIAVGIEATSNFYRYKDGVFADDNCNGNANHAVLVVGYGNDGDNDYWIIKNSYGTTWGESGYMKLARNRENMCSIASFGIFPIVSWVK